MGRQWHKGSRKEGQKRSRAEVDQSTKLAPGDARGGGDAAHLPMVPSLRGVSATCSRNRGGVRGVRQE